MSESVPQPDPGCFENCPRNHIDVMKPNPIEKYARECRVKRCLGPIAVQGFSKDGQYIKGVFCGSRRLPAGPTNGEPA